MRRYVFVLLIAAAMSTQGSAQQGWEKPEPTRTAVPPDVAFELLHNPRSADTFRLNKVGGQVWRLQRVSGIGAETWVWKPILPPDDIASMPRSNVINYQLFVSPTNATYLLNVNNGATWVLRSVSGEWRWLPITLER